jgi:hypothetical protein
VYPQIIKLLAEDKRVEAAKVATDFINKKLKIPEKVSKEAERALWGFHSIRNISSK